MYLGMFAGRAQPQVQLLNPTTPMSAPSLEEALQGCGLRVVSKRTIQSLWAGYGKAIEVSAKRIGEGGDGGGAGGAKGKRGRAGGKDTDCVELVVKQVSLPHGVGRDDDVGHQRKVRSYKVRDT
jgi:hypothetical protein